MKIKVLIFCIALFIGLSITNEASASSNFDSDYQVTYAVNENGMTHAIVNVTITNTTPDMYISAYKMQIGFDSISNVQISDPDGPIQPRITKTDDGQIIDMTFNKKAIGLNSKLPFTLSFDTPEIAKRNGKIWEIYIPGLANSSDFRTFAVTVTVPPSFGSPVYIKPAQQSNGLTFTKEQLGKSGISIAFGDKQLYSFHLRYSIFNDNIYPIQTEIALPPTTNYQNIAITDINPKPRNVVIDKDGNWLAQYYLLPSQKQQVVVEGVAEVALKPEVQELTQEDLAIYLKPQPYWESGNDEIRELADELRTPDAIYNYVVKTLKYDFSRVTDDKGRKGALQTLKNPDSAVCREFTDLFIGLARAAGIPARELNGFAYTENEKQRPLSLVNDVLHAWPEYYDAERKMWIMVDPTWGNTMGGIDYFSVMDFDHLVFAIKGMESDYPIAAGGYDDPAGKDAKDVNVTFADSMPEKDMNFFVTSNLTNGILAGLPVNSKITIKNNGAAMIPPQIVYLSSPLLQPNYQTVSINGIPPYGTITKEVHYKPTSLIASNKGQYTIQLGDKTVVLGISVSPMFLTIWGIGGLLVLLLLIFLFAFLKRKKQK